MHENLNPEEYARKAIEMLEKANKFDEDENNPTKAIDYYRKAAEYLERSGYMPHRVEDIRKRIEELKVLLEKNQVYSQLENQAQADQLQLDAFSLLDKAQNYVKNNQINNAINYYDQAILKLAKSGWSNEQLINLIQNRNEIAEEGDIEKIDMEQLGIESEKQTQLSSYQQREPPKTQDQTKRQKAEYYKEQKRKEQDIQNEAFSLIDKAKEFEQSKNFEEAIMNYEKAIRLLNSIGWSQQTKNIQTEINRLRQEENKYKHVQAEKKKSDNYLQDVLMNKLASEEADISKNADLISFEETKKKEERTQKKAFDLIDIGKNLEREKKYNQAIEKFEDAIKLLKEINWDSYIHPIRKFISHIKIKKEREEKLKHLRKKREDESSEIQKSFKKKQKESFVKASQKLELNRRQFEESRINQIQKEQNFFNVLNTADKNLKMEEYKKAIENYRQSLELLQNLGSGWESYTPYIKSTIEHIKDKQDKMLDQKLKDEKKQQQAIEDEMQFQTTILKKLEDEQQKLREKQKELEEKEEKKEVKDQLKNKALQYMDSAKNYTNQRNYDKAIYAYRKANNIFAKIGWSDEIPIIKETIDTLEKRKLKEIEEEEERRKKRREELQAKEKEEQFRELMEQRQKYEKKKKIAHQVVLEQREKMIQEQQNYRDAAYNLLEEAQKYLKAMEPEYEKAISLYSEAKDILSENVGWEPEIRNLNELIYDLQKERERFLEKKRVEREEEIQREKERERFEQELKKRREEEQKKKRSKELKLEEYKKRKEALEKTKNETLKLIDRAHDYANANEFSKAYETFDQVIEGFKKLGWNNQIPYIQEEIQRTKDLEAKVTQEKLKSQKLKKESEKKKEIETVKDQLQIKKQEEAVSEVENLTHDVSDIIERKKEEIQRRRGFEREELIREAKSFKRDMGQLIKIKEDLRKELEKEEEAKRKEAEKLQKEKEMQELDDIKKMIKEAKNKDKK